MNSNENGVWPGSAISPDGKYLAYRDRNGLELKLIETGDTQTIADPEGLKGRVSWEVVGWFHDSARFLANAHPAEQGDPDFWNPAGTSIWAVRSLEVPCASCAMTLRPGPFHLTARSWLLPQQLSTDLA